MRELAIHAAGQNAARVLCGQIKMRTRARRHGLRYTSVDRGVTCRKCLAKLGPPADPWQPRIVIKRIDGPWLVQIRCDECGGEGGFVAQDEGGWYGERCWCDNGWTTVCQTRDRDDAVARWLVEKERHDG